MGQKINPNLFQLVKSNKWRSKYIEKTSVESSIYSKKDQEIRNFIFRFFKLYKIKLHNCYLYYLNKSLHIFISYYSNLNFFRYKIKKVKKNILQSALLKCFLYKKPLLKWSVYKKRIMYRKLKTEIFLEKLFKSLTCFTKKKFTFFLILKELKFNTKQIIMNKKIKKAVKKIIISLRKYQRNKFFKEGVNLLFNCAINKKSSKLLAQFIAIQLKSLKRHNFFLRFIENTLKLFKNNGFSKFKGIKIIIKGRLNRRPRARNKIIKISNSVPVLSIDSIIDYSEATAFTPNGTIGIKVWIHEF